MSHGGHISLDRLSPPKSLSCARLCHDRGGGELRESPAPCACACGLNAQLKRQNTGRLQRRLVLVVLHVVLSEKNKTEMVEAAEQRGSDGLDHLGGGGEEMDRLRGDAFRPRIGFR